MSAQLDNGEPEKLLRCTGYASQAKVAKHLGLPDVESITKLKQDDKILEISEVLYSRHVAPEIEKAAAVSIATGRQRQRENASQFKAFEKNVLIADDNGEKKYRRRNPPQDTVTDGFAVAITHIVADIDRHSDGPLHHCSEYSLHAKRCIAWSLLKHMIHEASPSRCAKIEQAKANTEKRAKRGRTARAKTKSIARGATSKSGRKRSKVNDTSAVVTNEYQSESESSEDEGSAISSPRMPSQLSNIAVSAPAQTQPQQGLVTSTDASGQLRGVNSCKIVQESVSARRFAMFKEVIEEEETEPEATDEEE